MRKRLKKEREEREVANERAMSMIGRERRRAREAGLSCRGRNV